MKKINISLETPQFAVDKITTSSKKRKLDFTNACMTAYK